MLTINTDRAWNAVLTHDRRCDGAFVYAVSSTGVYCRPSCPSRRPARHRVSFFPAPQQAEAAGFRACLRCRPQSLDGSETAQRIERARRYLDAHSDEPVTLRSLAAEIGLSPAYLQRTFTQMIGLSPKAYQDSRRMAGVIASLQRGDTVTNATYDAGFGSSSRLYERTSSTLGMTPSAFRSGGAWLTLRYATAKTTVGRLLVAVTDRGIAAVTLGDSDESLVAVLQRDYPKATLHRDTKGLATRVRDTLRCLNGNAELRRLPLDVKATAFQHKVWKALQQIPRGSTRSYREIAHAIGQSTATRAVARACATNPVAVVIPCHRAIRKDGQLAGYRWGLERKKRLLALERT
jgi:AraC family transcriptional regulator of adaptative response/methylated-DNA-[protein]-cysteine methyltransferase